MKRIAIIDYGMGNLRSVQKAFEFIGVKPLITSKIQEIESSDAIILPGVGAFPDAMENLSRLNLDKIIVNEAKKGKPLMGICLGMQLLFNESEEVRLTEGLGLIDGRVKKFEVDLKIPQIGWNNINISKPCTVLKDTKEGEYVYFVHSYYAELKNEENLNAYCNYGVKVPAVVSRGNIFGLQFHPEKSGEVGIKMLKNFWELIK
ncbi:MULTISPECIES: imidazole glycerol phosphate synthase subunit HisH [Clostridium]|uniref:imidazole glycerol phosphate synthase subunit HisH n=1 Tax=Clostridium TaxID=1485 RepID=UPI00069DBE5D|nr:MULTISPECIES: imidazole glycerol phosphate synthase subunit HisH [Clostridium]KOF56898.1 imidazole glycerol phosphate synthase [Clostridium sp. DMHC 10]MCD2347329.1 imidazole glycerol phosphate synthase subunit HisH [Clostridium guangxiense]